MRKLLFATFAGAALAIWLAPNPAAQPASPAVAQAPVTIEAEADTWIRSDGSFRVYTNWGCEWVTSVGTGYETNTGGADANRALVRFNLSGLPAATIQSAVLRLTIAGFYDTGAPGAVFPVDVHNVLPSGIRTPWVEGNGAYGVYPAPPGQSSNWPPGCDGVDPASGVVWRGYPDDPWWGAPPNTKVSQPDFDPVKVASLTIPVGTDWQGNPLPGAKAVGTVVDFDITSLVVAWVAGSVANEGLLLRDITTDNNTRGLYFGAREGRMFPDYYPNAVDGPRLVVTFADTTPPTISCATADGLWHAANVALACTAEDGGSGLANGDDANFTLTTGVAAGAEDAGAVTNSQSICDNAGNCATAGPIGGNMIDRKAPLVALTVPANNGVYTLGQAVKADYSCTDAGSGIASCTGTAASGSPVPTGSAGSFTFSVSSADNVGHTASATASYAIGYGVCLLYDPSKPHKSGSTVPIKLQLCDATGGNVSTAGTVVKAIKLKSVSGNAPLPAQGAGNANPSNNFRYTVSLAGYIFNLKTTGLAAGAYELIFTAGADPTEHAVLFQVR